MTRFKRPQASLALRLALAILVCAGGAAAAGAWLARRAEPAPWRWWLLGGVLMLAAFILARLVLDPLRQLLRALAGMVASYREGDFGSSLVVERTDELGDLMGAHNALATALREQRAHLVQRELLLDTVMQNSPVAIVLVGAGDRVAYANVASRHLLNDGRTLVGLRFQDLVEKAPPALRTAASGSGDHLVTAQIGGIEETFHLSQRTFLLQGRSYRLFLLKRLTRELSRQEVATWKSLIRVLSHELNNSLGPIASLAHSGAELARRGDHADLPGVFAAIGDRARHLHEFIGSYATFAKLPAPRPQAVEWRAFLVDLARQSPFSVIGSVPSRTAHFDRGQVEQALLNLLKNAAEAGGPPDAVELEVTPTEAGHRVEVRDRGSGMTPTVLAQALLPFYSTKRNGTGLGLALAREIAEAHGGRIALANRAGGGLVVSIELPEHAPVVGS